MSRAQTMLLTGLALIAFASNSLLTRAALATARIDAASFTTLRLVSGAVMLGILIRLRPNAGKAPVRRDFVAAGALFLYAAPFSFAYLRIGAAVGALVLFGVVQLTMIGWSLARGERPSLRTILALTIATSGLLALLLPSAETPDAVGTALMAVAGVAWGIYSLRGRGSADPLAANASNFAMAAPLALLTSLLLQRSVSWTASGIGLAVTSGAVASAVGYAVWYHALRGLAAAQAAIVQLSVPVIAALGAGLLLGETVGLRLILCGIVVLGGVALALLEKRPTR